MSDGGKGSNPRPFSVSMETYSKNFDAIFRRSENQQSQVDAQTETQTEQPPESSLGQNT